MGADEVRERDWVRGEVRERGVLKPAQTEPREGVGEGERLAVWEYTRVRSRTGRSRGKRRVGGEGGMIQGDTGQSCHERRCADTHTHVCV